MNVRVRCRCRPLHVCSLFVCAHCVVHVTRKQSVLRLEKEVRRLEAQVREGQEMIGLQQKTTPALHQASNIITQLQQRVSELEAHSKYKQTRIDGLQTDLQSRTETLTRTTRDRDELAALVNEYVCLFVSPQSLFAYRLFSVEFWSMVFVV